jgi:hypothetical protein
VCPGLAHQTVSGALGPYNSKLATFEFLQHHSAIIHRTVRCAKRSNGYQRNGRLQRTPANATVRGQCAHKSEQPLEAHRTVHSTCPVRHRTVRCAHRQQPNPNSCLVVGGYKYPQPPPLQPSKHSTHCIKYKSNRLHSKDTIQVIDPLKVPNSTLAH